MIVNIREIPAAGHKLEGEIQQDIFELMDQGIRFIGPVSYRFDVSLVSDSLLVRGECRVGFELCCVRCLDYFPWRVELADAIFNEPIKGRNSIDLTDSIREDILLALPIYPHCDDGPGKRVCPARGQFEEAKGAMDEGSGHSVWADLEKLNSSPQD